MSQPDPASTRETTPSILRVIRLALIGGTVFFGAVMWFVSQQVVEPIIDAALLGMAKWVVLAAFGAAAVAILVIRQKWKAAEGVADKRSLNIAGWALAEAMTLVGALYIVLAGDPAFFVVGLLVQLVVSFVLLPVPEA